MYTSFGHGHVIPSHLPSDLKGSQFLVCSRTRGGTTIGPGCPADTHRCGWCLNVLQQPIIKWRRSIWDGSPAGPRGPSVFHEKQCPLPPPHCFLSLQPTHMASLRAYASLHQSVGPCQFSMAFLHMGPDGWFWRSEHPESTPASLTYFYQSWVCQWIYIFPESKG